jgi:S-adenosylmethionine hydrolase
MPDALITLTTDFGTGSPYVAAMKGVILRINPAVRLLDLSHDIPPQAVRQVDFFLASALPFFPKEALHVVVVDPGVGSDRALLYVEVAGQRLLAPDNGCWTSLAKKEEPARVIRLTEPRFWLPQVSSTFHGRDILAPVAAHLSLGIRPEELGQPVQDWVRLETPVPQAGINCLYGEVLYIDHFGNLITNFPADRMQKPDVLCVGKQTFKRFRWVRTYSDAAPGTLVVLASSAGLLEVAVAQGNAARKLKAAVGTPVVIGWTR